LWCIFFVFLIAWKTFFWGGLSNVPQTSFLSSFPMAPNVKEYIIYNIFYHNGYNIPLCACWCLWGPWHHIQHHQPLMSWCLLLFKNLKIHLQPNTYGVSNMHFLPFYYYVLSFCFLHSCLFVVPCLLSLVALFRCVFVFDQVSCLEPKCPTTWILIY
jgi:hypothetical protein